MRRAAKVKLTSQVNFNGKKSQTANNQRSFNEQGVEITLPGLIQLSVGADLNSIWNSSSSLVDSDS